MQVPTVGELPEPMEFFDLEHADSATLSITSAQMGTAQIHPKDITQRNVRIHMQQNGLTAPPVAGTPITIRIPVLRLFGTRVDATSPLHYWDVSSKTLQADLMPRLTTFNGAALQVKITAQGHKPTKRYPVEFGGADGA
jgi:hypothetical protein